MLVSSQKSNHELGLRRHRIGPLVRDTQKVYVEGDVEQTSQSGWDIVLQI